IAVDLAYPRQMALRKAVDEKDLRPLRIAPFLRRDRQPVRRLHVERLVFQVLRRGALGQGNEQRGGGERRKGADARMHRHEVLPAYLFVVARLARRRRAVNSQSRAWPRPTSGSASELGGGAAAAPVMRYAREI